MTGTNETWTGIRRAMAEGRQGLVVGVAALREEALRSLRLAVGPGRRVAVVGGRGSAAADVLALEPEELAAACAPEKDEILPVAGVLVEDWDELAPTRRGVRLQLTLARLRALTPDVLVWGLAAPCAETEELARALVAPEVEPVVAFVGEATRVRLATVGREELEKILDPGVRTLVVTAEEEEADLWRKALEVGYDDASVLVATIEEAGAHLPEVARVILAGSPRLLATLLPQLDARVTVTCVPTHGLELLEVAATRRLLARGTLRSAAPAAGTSDVLTEHFAACARGGRFTAAELLAQARQTPAYAAFDGEALSLSLREALAGRTLLHVAPDAPPSPSPLDEELRRVIGELARGLPATEPEAYAATPLIEEQARLSHVPHAGELLLETWEPPFGSALFVHPFAGRAAHEAMATELALKLARELGTSFQVTATEHGFALRSATRVDFRERVTLDALAGRTWVWTVLHRPSPLAQPLVVPAPSPEPPPRQRFRPLFAVPPQPSP